MGMAVNRNTAILSDRVNMPTFTSTRRRSAELRRIHVALYPYNVDRHTFRIDFRPKSSLSFRITSAVARGTPRTSKRHNRIYINPGRNVAVVSTVRRDFRFGTKRYGDWSVRTFKDFSRRKPENGVFIMYRPYAKVTSDVFPVADNFESRRSIHFCYYFVRFVFPGNVFTTPVISNFVLFISRDVRASRASRIIPTLIHKRYTYVFVVALLTCVDGAIDGRCSMDIDNGSGFGAAAARVSVVGRQ